MPEAQHSSLALGLGWPPEAGAHPFHISQPHTLHFSHIHTPPPSTPFSAEGFTALNALTHPCSRACPHRLASLTKTSNWSNFRWPRRPASRFCAHFPRPQTPVGKGPSNQGVRRQLRTRETGGGWAESFAPPPRPLPPRCPINHSVVAVQLGIPAAQCHTQPAEQWDYFRGERTPRAGAQAAAPPSLNPSLGTQPAPAAARDVWQSGRGWRAGGRAWPV